MMSDAATNEAAIRAAREHNTLALIHRKLSNENLCDIFIALVYLDTPSLLNPQGWYLQINGVCHLWRELAVHCAELWARSIGSFPSRDMTDLAIQRAGASLLSLDGHFEDHEGPGYILTGYQLSLVEKYASRLRSLGHDDYWAWSELFYCIRAFPELETARIWDDSGPNEWDECIDTPRLQSLYMNNALIPFNAPALRYLRVDMDNIYWRSSRDLSGLYEPAPDSCEGMPRVFPTREFIAFLQRSPLLERLIITDMPFLISKNLPPVFDLYAELSKLRGLHLGGRSEAMGDLWQRLRMPQDAQVFIDADYTLTETHNTSVRYSGRISHYLEKGVWQGLTLTSQHLHNSLLQALHEHLKSPVYDSLRLGMTPSYDLMLQMWSSEAHEVGLELSTSLERTKPKLGPAFTLRLPVGTCELLNTSIDQNISQPSQFRGLWIEDAFLRFQNDMAKYFYFCIGKVLDNFPFASSMLQHIDLTDIPYVEQELVKFSSRKSTHIQPDVTLQWLWPWARLTSLRGNVILNWTLIYQVSNSSDPEGAIRLYSNYLGKSVNELTVVDFPCASFLSWKRYDERHNAEAWDILLKFLERYPASGERTMLALKLAESTSEMSNMKRSDEPEYEHTIPGSYEDAVRAVTEKGYQRIAPFVTSFEDLRIHTWT
ncbi:hypothetical protein PENSPDRAFT_758356 [Peniophora sp. CONT]|nr:hypothetical protein PENSPDRAFT_758356 [Peniophora sp. CONT]